MTEDTIPISLDAPGWESGISLTLPSQTEKGFVSLLSTEAAQTIIRATRTQSS